MSRFSSRLPLLHLSKAARLRLLLYALTLAAFALRLYRLGAQNIWWDEGWSISLARDTLAGTATTTGYDTQPPLYYWALHLWRVLFGESEFALRFLSVLAGAMVLPLVYRIGRRFADAETGLIAAALTCVSCFCIAWSQEMRMYTPAAALALASLWLAPQIWRNGKRFWPYLLVSAVLLNTIYLSSIYIIVTNAVWLVELIGGKAKYWRRWILSQFLLALTLLPWLSFALPRMRTWSVAEPIGIGRFFYYYWGALVTGTSAHIEQQTPLLLALGFLLLIATLAHAWRSCKHVLANLALPIAAILPPLIVFILSQPHSFLYSPRPEPRYLSLFAPLVYLYLATGLAALLTWRRWFGVGASVAALAVLIVPLPGYFCARIPEDDYRSLANTLRTYVQPQDLVLLHNDSDWPIFAYYYTGQWRGVPNDVKWEETGAQAYLAPYIAGRNTVWMVINYQALAADPNMLLEKQAISWCGENCQRQEWRFGVRRLLRFSKDQPLPPPDPAAGQEIAGKRWRAWWPVQILPVNNVWRAYLWWPAADSTVPQLSVSCGNSAPAVIDGAFEGSGGAFRRYAYERFFSQPGSCRVRVLSSSGDMPLTNLRIAARPGSSQQPIATGERQSINVIFNEGINLQGYAVSGTASSGQNLCLTLYWQAQKPPQHTYTVFVHLIGSQFNIKQGNFLWGQHDSEPVNGSRPLPSWQSGEEIADTHCFTVAVDAPAGDYQLEIGFYDASSGQRLPLADGSTDSLLINGPAIK